MSRLLEAEEEKPQKKLTSHNWKRPESLTNTNENSFLLATSSTELLESKIFQKVNGAPAISTEQSNLDPKCEENLNLEKKELDEMHRSIILSYYDIRVEEACKEWGRSLFFVKTDYRRLNKNF